MKKIFASLLAVVMIVACFAVSTVAASGSTTMTDGSEIDVDISVDNAYAGEIATITLTISIDNPMSSNDEPVIDWYYAADCEDMTYVTGSAKAVNNMGKVVDGDTADNYIGVGAFGDAEGNAITAGSPYTCSLSLQFAINAAAGTTITFTDDGSTFYIGSKTGAFADAGLAEFSFTVGSKAPAVVIGEAASVGAQIRAEKYEDVSDIRFAFTADETSAVIASVVYKITCNGKEITVDGKTASHDGLFKVVVENVPADYYDADFAVDFVVTYADGTVKTASDINNINAVAAA